MKRVLDELRHRLRDAMEAMHSEALEMDAEHEAEVEAASTLREV